MKQFRVTSDKSLTYHCTICNAELEKASREEAKDFVPESIYYAHRDFIHCPACHKFYWKGIRNEFRTEGDVTGDGGG